MTALRWSLFVECMEWLSCLPWTSRLYVCVAVCSWTWMCCYWRLICPVCYEAVILSARDILLSNWTHYDWLLLRSSWTNRPYVCINVLVCARIWKCYCLAFDTVWGLNFTLMRYFAVRWQWRLCAYLRFLLNVWNGCRTDPKPTARTCVLLLYVLDLKVLIISVRCGMRL